MSRQKKKKSGKDKKKKESGKEILDEILDKVEKDSDIKRTARIGRLLVGNNIQKEGQ